MSDLVFRRVKGRIVPMKLNRDQRRAVSEGSKGAAIAGTGIALASASGTTYKRAVSKSSSMAFKAFNSIESVLKRPGTQESLFDYAKRAQNTGEAFSKSEKAFRTANRLSSAANLLKKASIPAGAALVTLGALKALNGIPRDKRKEMNPALVAGGAAAATLIAPKAFNYSKNAFEAGMHGTQGARKYGSAAFESAKPFLKKFGVKLFKAGI